MSSRNRNDGNNSRGGSKPQSSNNSSNTFYEEFLSRTELQEGLGNGTLFKGALRVLPMRRRSAFVTADCGSLTTDILVDGEQHRNRAIEADIVVVQLLPIAEWTPKVQQNKELASTGSESLPPPPMQAQEQAAALREAEQLTASAAIKSDALWCPQPELMEALGANQTTTPSTAATESANTASTPESIPTKHEVDRLAAQGNLQPRGKVVGIWRRMHRRTVTGQIQLPASLTQRGSSDSNSSRTVRLPENEGKLFFKPCDPRYQSLLLLRSSLPEAFVAAPLLHATHIFAADLVSGEGMWPASSKFGFGDNVRSVGQAGSIAAETEALLVENGVRSALFSDEVLESLRPLLGEHAMKHSGTSANNNTGAGASSSSSSSAGTGVESEGWRIPAEEIAKRRDLRSTRIFTIDPPNAKDLDDALHITPLDDDKSGRGVVEVGVHIADVSYFVSEGTALDEEAKLRATSVYLVQKVVPMLPPVLCEELCSLNPNVDRLAFSVIWRMHRDGTLVRGERPWVGRTVIRSCAKLDYGTAQKMIDGEIGGGLGLVEATQGLTVAPGAEVCAPAAADDDDSFLSAVTEDMWESRRRPVGQSAAACCRDVLLMNTVAQARRKTRLSNGALVLTRTKMTFRLDEAGNPSASPSGYVMRQSNFLVEEYMLLANYLIAQELLVRVGNEAFLRNHPAPNEKQLQGVATGAMESVCAVLNVPPVDFTSSLTVQRSLAVLTAAAARPSAPPGLREVISTLLMMPMQLANYIVAGTMESKRWAHYALAIPYYTHFTSPIRRYADVMVHRLLGASLDAEAAGGGNAKSRGSGSAAAKEAEERRLKELKDVADHCNEMRKSAKAAQERSDEVFLAVHLLQQRQRAGSVTERDAVGVVDGVVIGVGEKSLTVLTVGAAYGGLQERIFVDQMIPTVASQFDTVAQQLTLTCGGTFGSIALSALTQVRLRVEPTETAPIGIKIVLLGLL